MLYLIWLLPIAVWVAYTAKAWWVARDHWSRFPFDTKAFYLLVAPPLTLALDVLVITDKMFYAPAEEPNATAGRFISSPALRNISYQGVNE